MFKERNTKHKIYLCNVSGKLEKKVQDRKITVKCDKLCNICYIQMYICYKYMLHKVLNMYYYYLSLCNKIKVKIYMNSFKCTISFNLFLFRVFY